MNLEQLRDWLDRHHVHTLRMECTLPSGLLVGPFVHRDRFVETLPLGERISATILHLDQAGEPFSELPLPREPGAPAELYLKPDLATLITNGTDPDLGHCIVELVDRDGSASGLDPRTLLRKSTEHLAALGLDAEIGLQIQFNLYETPLAEAKARNYRNLAPRAVTETRFSHLGRNAYVSQPFMQEVASRLEWRGIEWRSWHAGPGPGMLALDLAPCDPLTAADKAIRVRQSLFEVAADHANTITFMAQPAAGRECFLHIEAAITRSAAADRTAPEAELQENWSRGIRASLAGASALLFPTVNSYRARAHAGTATQGAKGPATVIDAAGDANPYLALAAIVAGGLSGVVPDSEKARSERADAVELESPPPTSLASAIEAFERDARLTPALGAEFKHYWARNRHWELKCLSSASEPVDQGVTDWELRRYFELA